MKNFFRFFLATISLLVSFAFPNFSQADVLSASLTSSASASSGNTSLIDFTISIQATEPGNFIQVFVAPASGPGAGFSSPLSSGFGIPNVTGTFEVFDTDWNLAASNVGGFLFNNSYQFFQPSSNYVFEVYEIILNGDGTAGLVENPVVVFSCLTAGANSTNDCATSSVTGDLDGDGTIDDFNGDGIDDDLNNNSIPDYNEDEDTENDGNNGTDIVVNGPDLPNSNSFIPCDGGEADPCDFNDFMALLNGAINFALFVIALPLAALGIMVTGFKILMNSTSANALKEAKSAMWNIIEGLVIALAAWLIIKAVLLGLGYDPISGNNNDIFDVLNITAQ